MTEELKQGRELDALIARKVMKGAAISINSVMGQLRWINPDSKTGEVPYFSTSIEAAWQVVEKLKAFEPEILWSDHDHLWYVQFQKGRYGYSSTSESAPHAICLAALTAVEDMKERK